MKTQQSIKKAIDLLLKEANKFRMSNDYTVKGLARFRSEVKELRQQLTTVEISTEEAMKKMHSKLEADIQLINNEVNTVLPDGKEYSNKKKNELKKVLGYAGKMLQYQHLSSILNGK